MIKKFWCVYYTSQCSYKRILMNFLKVKTLNKVNKFCWRHGSLCPNAEIFKRYSCINSCVYFLFSAKVWGRRLLLHQVEKHSTKLDRIGTRVKFSAKCARKKSEMRSIIGKKCVRKCKGGVIALNESPFQSYGASPAI